MDSCGKRGSSETCTLELKAWSLNRTGNVAERIKVPAELMTPRSRFSFSFLSLFSQRSDRKPSQQTAAAAALLHCSHIYSGLNSYIPRPTCNLESQWNVGNDCRSEGGRERERICLARPLWCLGPGARDGIRLTRAATTCAKAACYSQLVIPRQMQACN